MFNILITGLVSLLTDMSTEMVYPLIPLYLATLGAQPAILGLIEGFAESSASILKVLSGNISDRLRQRKKIAILGYAGSTLGKLLLYLSQSWGLVFAGRMLDRIGKGIRVAPRDALIADACTGGRSGRGFGLHRAMDTLGAVIGVLLALYIASRVSGNLVRSSYQLIFLISLIPALVGVLLLFFVRETKVQYTPRSLPWFSFKTLPPPLKRFLIFVGIFALGNSSNQFLLLRMKSLGWNTVPILSLYLIYNIIYSLSSYPVGKLSDRIGKKRLLVTGYLLYGLVYLAFALVLPQGRRFVPWLLFGIYGLYSGLTEGLEKALVADIAPEPQRASLLGLHATLTGLGLLPASLVAGGLWNLYGPNAPFFFGGILGILAALGLLLWV